MQDGRMKIAIDYVNNLHSWRFWLMRKGVAGDRVDAAQQRTGSRLSRRETSWDLPRG